MVGRERMRYKSLVRTTDRWFLVSAAWLIGVAGLDVGNVFKPSSCKLSFDRRHGERRALCEYV